MDMNSLSSSSTPTTVSIPRSAKSRGISRGTARARGGRRKQSINRISSEDDESESGLEILPENVRTASGRKIQRPTQFDPNEMMASPRKRGPYKRTIESRICKTCQRGHSPNSNMIVFCDGCNSAYHQLCHDPPIDDLIIEIAEAEWFCASCQGKRDEKPLETGSSGQNLPVDVKKTYLASLPLSKLVDLLFFCEKQHPELKFYSPNTERIVAGIRGTSIETPLSRLAASAIPKRPAAPSKLSIKLETNGGIHKADIQYEEYIIQALTLLGEPDGARPKHIWEWISTNCSPAAGRNVRSEAQGALQRAQRSGRIVKEGAHAYKLNPKYVVPPVHTPKRRIQPTPAPSRTSSTKPNQNQTQDDEGLWIDDNTSAFSHRFNGTSLSFVSNGTSVYVAPVAAVVRHITNVESMDINAELVHGKDLESAQVSSDPSSDRCFIA